MARKPWNVQLNDSKDYPLVKTIPPEAALRFGGARLLLAPPLYYDAIMKQVPKGRVLTTDRIRAYLAKKHSADNTCPLCTGIFINIAAFASVERKGVNETPYWRILKSGGELNEKFPGGIDGHKMLLEMEGHTIIQKGKRYFVEGFEDKLFDIEEIERK